MPVERPKCWTQMQKLFQCISLCSVGKVFCMLLLGSLAAGPYNLASRWLACKTSFEQER